MKKLIVVLIAFIFSLTVSVISASAQAVAPSGTTSASGSGAVSISNSSGSNSSGGTIGGTIIGSGQVIPKKHKKRYKKPSDTQKQEDTNSTEDKK